MKTTSSVFNAYSRYYDLLYRDKDYLGEVNYIQALLNRQGISKGNLLEFGSGTGKHASLLANRGYHVHGIERSAEMVAQAVSVNGFTCQQGDICNVQLGRKFDAVLSLFHVVSYQTSNDAVRAVFERAADHLDSGGVFLFDVWYSPAVYSQQPLVRVKRMVDEKIEITRIAEPILYPNENRVDVQYTFYVRDTISGKVDMMSEVHPMRHFSLPELDFIAKAAGFEQLGAEEFLTGLEPSGNTWGVCVVLRKT
jgi:SAM-dependent methyltransferase